MTPLSTATKENVLSLNQQVKELLDEPELITTLQTGFKNLHSLAYQNEEQIWTSGLINDIKCFNMTGSLLHTIQTKSDACPFDIAVDSNGDVLYSDLPSKTIYKVTNGRKQKLFVVKPWFPANLCVTSTGDVLVTMYSDDKTQSKVVRYSGSTKKQTIQFDDNGKPLYSGNSYIKYITQNSNEYMCS